MPLVKKGVIADTSNDKLILSVNMLSAVMFCNPAYCCCQNSLT